MISKRWVSQGRVRERAIKIRPKQAGAREYCPPSGGKKSATPRRSPTDPTEVFCETQQAASLARVRIF